MHERHDVRTGSPRRRLAQEMLCSQRQGWTTPKRPIAAAEYRDAKVGTMVVQEAAINRNA